MILLLLPDHPRPHPAPRQHWPCLHHLSGCPDLLRLRYHPGTHCHHQHLHGGKHKLRSFNCVQQYVYMGRPDQH